MFEVLFQKAFARDDLRLSDWLWHEEGANHIRQPNLPDETLSEGPPPKQNPLPKNA